MEAVLEMRDITKRFGSMVANDHICLNVQAGEVHTLLGENGAGKSTLMNILFGLYRASAGQIFIRGTEVGISCPADAVRCGIGMVHQHFMLVEAMTVFDNIILGTNKEYGVFINRKKLQKKIIDLSDKYGLNLELDKKICEISIGEQQRVEILKALYRGAEILVLDEPTAVLTDEETEGLFKIIYKLTKENKSIIFISHKMREVMRISDRITILRDGRAIQTYHADEVTQQQLANRMTGKKLVEETYEKNENPEMTAMKLDGICFHKNSKHNGLQDITLAIGKGEILGIAGVDGNGQSQLAQIATGNIVPEEGSLYLQDKQLTHISPDKFINYDISHIPEDRNKMGLIGDMSVLENLILKDSASEQFSRGHGLFLSGKKIRKNAEKLCKKYDIRCSSVHQMARELSGGNQQKVILARELEKNPKFLVAVHPTRGLDIGAANFIHDCMIRAKKEGCGILLISADLDEVLKMSDRIAVIFEGQIMGIYSGKNPPVDKISLAMAGKS